MAQSQATEESARLLTGEPDLTEGRASLGSFSSVSTTSLILERLKEPSPASNGGYTDALGPDGRKYRDKDDDGDVEDGAYGTDGGRPVGRRFRHLLWIVGGLLVGAWLLALVVFIVRQAYMHSAGTARDSSANWAGGSGKKITLDQVLDGAFRARTKDISWIDGADGEDGLLLEKGLDNEKGYLVVEDVRSKSNNDSLKTIDSKTLMKEMSFEVGSERVSPSQVWPSRSLEQVLVLSKKEQNWRHSYTGLYWIFDVATQKAQALDPAKPDARVALASWSPESDAIVFTREKNLFLRDLKSSTVKQITTDGGPDLLYGVPDWVYEEEVFAGNSATWWAEDGKYIAFLRTDEARVPEYPIQYFVSRPSGKQPDPGEENYPEVREIKYPKAGAPNPVVDLQFYDVDKAELFSVSIDGDFPDDDRLITEVVWAGSSGKVLVRESNRVSDVLRMVLIDVKARTGRVVRSVDLNALDGGWLEVNQKTRYIPKDEAKGRPDEGYIDAIVHEDYDHIGYFSPLDNPEPLVLTSGEWEVVEAPSAVDLENNLVYFVGTKEAPIERHVYSVKLDGTDLKGVTETSTDGYYDVSFSTGAGYALLSYNGPDIPWQTVISTPSNPVKYEHIVEENKPLTELAMQTALPIDIYTNVTVDGFTLQVLERRPPDFDGRKKYPVIFHLYGGPGSQTVDKKFGVDFQAYLAASLGYIVVTVDGRGTGYIGRKARCIVRGNLGYYEARDQIETAKIWAGKEYVDASRIAVWGWSYGGYLTLKTLEEDAGATFRYGMAVAPVTDWRFYDSIYTERYMRTPQANKAGYDNATVSNMEALAKNVRFLVMHGVADDNVHMQNSLTLLDKLDLASVDNYDMHFFPDSDHSIRFHNANRMVYDRLRDWVVNAFNGEWLVTDDAEPEGLAVS
ncbi:MAG: hypothetical protein M1832_002051 [Thelocarpon impressellum]|nr:MAG: hypothetical protein M1832_002051 [Thelocarpon impressellum]